MVRVTEVEPLSLQAILDRDQFTLPVRVALTKGDAPRFLPISDHFLEEVSDRPQEHRSRIAGHLIGPRMPAFHDRKDHPFALQRQLLSHFVRHDTSGSAASDEIGPRSANGTDLRERGACHLSDAWVCCSLA